MKAEELISSAVFWVHHKNLCLPNAINTKNYDEPFFEGIIA